MILIIVMQYVIYVISQNIMIEILYCLKLNYSTLQLTLFCFSCTQHLLDYCFAAKPCYDLFIICLHLRQYNLI